MLISHSLHVNECPSLSHLSQTVWQNLSQRAQSFFFSHKMQIMSPCLMTFNVAEQPKFDLIMFCLCLFNCSYEFFFLIFKESLYIYLQFYLQYHCELLLF